MITRLSIALCWAAGLAASAPFAAELDASLHGIRNRKCAESEEAAKTQILDELRDSKRLCQNEVSASQSEGWTCRSGGDCKKGLYRCNTQYRCGTVSTAVSVPEAKPPAPKPVTRATPTNVAPVPLPAPGMAVPPQ